MSSRALAHKISFLVSLRGCLHGVLWVILREREAMFIGRRKDSKGAMSYLVQRARLHSSSQPYMTRFIHWETSIIIRADILSFSPPFSPVCRSPYMQIPVHVKYVGLGADVDARYLPLKQSLSLNLEFTNGVRLADQQTFWIPLSPSLQGSGDIGKHHHAWLLPWVLRF